MKAALEQAGGSRLRLIKRNHERPAPEIGAPRRNHCRALTKLEYFDFKSSYAQMWKKILIDWTCYATVSERRAAGGAR